MLTGAPLGKVSHYQDQYNSGLLFPIARSIQRNEINILNSLPFKGVDAWNAYEVSWLNKRGKPEVAMAKCIFPCESPFIIESKSFKLYLNSLNQTMFDSLEVVKAILIKDLSAAAGASVHVDLFSLAAMQDVLIPSFQGECLDTIDITCDTYQTHPDFLQTDNQIISETVYSNLLKSNCLVTGQPDWASIQIQYTGNKIQHAGLLQYLISFRQHHEFHEQCVERIFMDIMTQCAPTDLSVYACFTRRGGLDINPYRSTNAIYLPDFNVRLARQ